MTQDHVDKAAKRLAARKKRLARQHKEKTAGKHQRIRRYVILAKHKETGQIFGYYEKEKKLHAEIVTLWDSSRYYEYARKPDYWVTTLNSIKNRATPEVKANYDLFIVRAGSKNCPIKIDYQRMYDRFGKFNAHAQFTQK